MSEKKELSSENDLVFKLLLESTNAIPWKLNWNTKKFDYIGPQIEHLLGWSPKSWDNVNDWANRMHPEDRELVVGFCVSQSQAGIDHEADYRALTKDGNYVWIRDVVHVVRDASGNVDSLLGFMFDISFRKNSESSPKLTPNILTTVFNLTPAECKVAILLADGLSQKEIAHKLGLKHDTVRKKLQTIYQKSATNQQSQLIRLMMQLPNRLVKESQIKVLK